MVTNKVITIMAKISRFFVFLVTFNSDAEFNSKRWDWNK